MKRQPSGDDGINSPVRRAWKQAIALAEHLNSSEHVDRVQAIRLSGADWNAQIAEKEAGLRDAAQKRADWTAGVNRR